MKKVLVTWAVFLLAAASLPGAHAQSAADREAIHELMWHYARAFESLDPDDYVDSPHR